MIDENTLPAGSTEKRLEIIREFVILQTKLVSEIVSKLDPTATEDNFEEMLPPRVTVDSTSWVAKAHGLGVMLTNPQTNIIVDAHVGFISSPSAFDAWRLVQYCESKFGTSETVKSWQRTLEELVGDGAIEPDKENKGHYVIEGND